MLTGATGFIGLPLTHLLLKDGREVAALVQNRDEAEKLRDVQEDLEMVIGDILEPGSWLAEIERLRPAACIHLAWITTPGIYLNSPLNARLAESGARLARALASNGCRRFVGIGTCFEYDTDCRILSESTPMRPRTPYAEAKLSLRARLVELSKDVPMRIAWARLFYLYGPGEHPNRLVPTLVRSMMNGEPAKLTDGRKIRDYLHVEDVASAIWAVGRGDLTGDVNIGSGVPVTIRALAECLAKIFETTADAACRIGEQPDNPLDPFHIQADIARLRRETGWTPKYDLESGLRHTADWWRGACAKVKQK
ncbi:NAD(P)-dependent oxidoreductase [bacterium]|nr:NAD(P)-dependent oxidoreductase [bacterium]